MKAFRFGLLLTVLCYSNYVNPVQGNRDSPDPGVLFYNNSYYAVTTGGWDGNTFPIWKSELGTNWTQAGWVFTKGPSWTRCCDYWAPQLHLINGKFMVYYTARSEVNGRLSIGVASATDIMGPYTDKGTFLVNNATEGVIDATVFTASNTKYLVYKVDGNAHGQPCLIYAIQLSADGMSVGGPATLLLRNDLSWEGGIVEAPWFIKEGNYYYLFYSSCAYNNECYSVGVARATNPLGPYEKHPTPILHTRSPKTSESWLGPGHCSVVRSTTGNWMMIYHAWPRNGLGTIRVMLADRVQFVNNWPTVFDGSPSETSQPTP